MGLVLDQWIRCESLACDAISCMGQLIYELAASSLPSPSNGVSANRCTPERLSEVGSDRASRCVWPPPLHKTGNALQTLIELQRVQLLWAKRPDAISRVGARLHPIIMHGQRVVPFWQGVNGGALGRKPGDLNDSAESTQFDADGMGATLIEAFPVHRFITRTDDSFQAMAGHFRLPEQRRKESASFWRVRRARIGAESCGCRFGAGKVRVKCSEQFRTKCFRLDSRKRHEAKMAGTQ